MSPYQKERKMPNWMQILVSFCCGGVFSLAALFFWAWVEGKRKAW